MKLYKLVFIFLLLLPGCENQIDSDSYSFINQNLQGKHDGNDWEILSGKAESGFFDDTTWNFTLYNINTLDNKTPFESGAYPIGSGYLSILFSFPKNPGLELRELSFNNSDSQTATFYNPDTNMNTISTSGAIEITSIDSSNNTITGRMDIWYSSDKDNFHVNGNFTVPYQE